MLGALPQVDKSTIVRFRKLPVPGWIRWLFRGLGALAPATAAALAARLFLTPTKARRRPEERAMLARGRRFDLETPVGRVAGWSWGAGPPVLLLHGWGGSAGQLTPFVAPLVERGRRAIALDLPAHGASPGRTSSIRHFAAAIRRAAEVHGPLAGVVAHSFGCAGATLALDGGVVAKRVVFVAPPSRFESFVVRVADAFGLDPRLERRFRRRIQERVGLDFDEIEPRRLARHQDAPLLVLHDRGDDEVLIEEGEELAAKWPGARFESTEGLGHLRLLRDRRVIGQAVEFLVPAEEGAPIGAL